MVKRGNSQHFEGDLVGDSRAPLGKAWRHIHGWCVPIGSIKAVQHCGFSDLQRFSQEFAPEPGAEVKTLELKERGGTEADVKAQLSSCTHPAGPWFVLLAYLTPSSLSLAFHTPIFPLCSLLSRPFPSLIYVI